MIAEFMGRLAIIVAGDALDVGGLTEVLWEAKNALSTQDEGLVAREGVKLGLTEHAISAVAEDGLQFAMNRDRAAVGRDSIDESMEEELFSTELRLRDREKYLLGKIDAALERLDANAIDVCEDCGEPIAFKRLLARPVTTLCIECKEEREREERTEAQIGRAAPV